MENIALQQNSGMANDSFFIQKQMEVMININNKKLNAEIDALKNTVTRLNEEMIEVRKKLSEGRLFAAPRKEEAKVVVCRQEDSDQTRLSTSSQNSQTSARPRYGDYSSEDVSINKFFYFGNKKS